jgi:hypothetical protein
MSHGRLGLVQPRLGGRLVADAAARASYLHHEFAPLADYPNKLFLPMATIERVFKNP